MWTQMIDGNSQSDVTAQDLEELSRDPKRRKTEVGHCQKVCQDGAKLQRIAYTDLQGTLGKEGIRQIRMRQGVSSDSDEQVGSSSQISVTQTKEEEEESDVVRELLSKHSAWLGL